MELRSGQRPRAPFLPDVATAIQFQPRRCYALLHTVCRDDGRTLRSFDVTTDQHSFRSGRSTLREHCPTYGLPGTRSACCSTLARSS